MKALFLSIEYEGSLNKAIDDCMYKEIKEKR